MRVSLDSEAHGGGSPPGLADEPIVNSRNGIEELDRELSYFWAFADEPGLDCIKQALCIFLVSLQVLLELADVFIQKRVKEDYSFEIVIESLDKQVC